MPASLAECWLRCEPALIFNDYDDEGRTTAVLLYLPHAFGMLLKAGLSQKGINVFDPGAGKSYGMAKCVNLASEHLKLTVSEDVTALSPFLLRVRCRPNSLGILARH